MQIDETLVRHVGKTARLDLTQSEIKEFLPQLKEIITSFSEISAINTEGVSPSFHVPQIKNAVREDMPADSLPNMVALKNTNHKKDGYFTGPRII
ncbi:MAG: Asp-tRNA(Asn)/Glu-tRNA(Gln) amidotransferase subunit GatC [archaeon]